MTHGSTLITLADGTVVLPWLADWSDPVNLKVRWETEVDTSIRGHESRQPLVAIPGVELEFTYWIGSTDEQEYLRAAMLNVFHLPANTLAGREALGKVAVPLHGYGRFVRLSGGQILEGSLALDFQGIGWIFFSEDEENFFVAENPATAVWPTWLADGAMGYPLLIGTIDPVSAKMETAVHSDVRVKVTAHHFALPFVQTYSVAPSLFRGRKVMPFVEDWSRNVAVSYQYDLEQEQIGFVRPVNKAATEFVRRKFTFTVPSTGVGPIQSFSGLGGRLAPFWLAGPVLGSDLVRGISPGVIEIAGGVDGLDGVLGEDFTRQLAIESADGTVRFAGIQAINKTGQQTICTLDANLEIAATDVLRWLYLVRLDSDVLSCSFLTEGVADVELNLVELPQEFAWAPVPNLKIPVYVIGGTPYLNTPGVAAYNVYTNGQPFIEVPINHGGIRVSIDGENEFELRTILGKVPEIDSNFPFPLEQGTLVEIWEFDTSTDYTMQLVLTYSTLLYSGTIASTSSDGPVITARVQTKLERLGQEVPRFRIQGRCNYQLGGPGCGFVSNGALKVQYSSLALDFGITLSSSLGVLDVTGLSGVNRSILMGGMVSYTRGGVTEFRQISNVFGGQVYVAYPFFKSTIDQLNDSGVSWIIRPSCAKTVTACKGYGNYANFGGHPIVTDNFTLKGVKQRSSGGKK